MKWRLRKITAVSQTATRLMPPGTQPPLIIQYNASSVPILELSIGSDTMPEQQLFDQTVNFLRPQLITIPGVQIPYPYGGKQRNIIVDLDPDRLYAYGISPADVSNAVNAQNLILPAGTTKIGKQEYPVMLNSTLPSAEAMNALPIKSVNGTTIYLRDVAHVRDGFAVQTNVVHANGKRGVLQPILKAGNASTLAVVNAVLTKLPQIKESLPKELTITPMFDQSIFVRALRDWRGERGRHRRRAHRTHDPSVPRQLAQHGHRDAFHPSLHPRLHHRPLLYGRNAQRHDPRRHGPRRRHPRR